MRGLLMLLLSMGGFARQAPQTVRIAADHEAGGPWLFPITPAARDGPAAAR